MYVKDVINRFKYSERQVSKPLLLLSNRIHVVDFAHQAIRLMFPRPNLWGLVLVLPFIVLLQHVVPVRIVQTEQGLDSSLPCGTVKSR